MSTYSDVENLVTLLSNGQANLTVFPLLYGDVVSTLGADLWHSVAVPIKFTAGSTLCNLPSNLLELLQVVYDDTVLSELNLRDLANLRNGWRNSPGNPVGFTRQAEQVKTIEVFPVPTQTSPPIIPVHGLPTGQDYAPGNGISIHSEWRQNVLPYLTLPVALAVLYREYTRESPHTDQNFAMGCKQLSDLLFEALK